MVVDHQDAGLYDNEVDFAALALVDADFARVYATGRLDFKDPAVVQQLTKSLLRRDFGISLELPDDRLCPPVPVRYNYIRYLSQLLEGSSLPLIDYPRAGAPVVGLDIGTGASAIYPLLGCSMFQDWCFFATDVDAHSLEYAKENVTRNRLNDRIRLRRSTEDSPLLALTALRVDRLDFVMCNPPFYDSTEEMQQSALAKGDGPSAVCTGAEVEMICPGGDAGFVARIIDESVAVGERVRWFTSMLGKLSTVGPCVQKLKAVGCTNWGVNVLKAGRKTKRWVLAWSWTDHRGPNTLMRTTEITAAWLPQATAQTVRATQPGAVADLNRIMGGLDLRWVWKQDRQQGIMVANGNTWSRSARRQRARDEDDVMPDAQVILAVSIAVTSAGFDVQWLQGRDHVMFESFCGMLKRAMKTL